MELDHYICNPNHDGGEPLCNLATDGCKTVQLKGASALECLQKKRVKDHWWDHQCEIMIIGEAPGSEEDAAKLPFVGKAGDLLFNSFLNKIDFDLEKIYITNTAKCAPPWERKPRKPTTQEVIACKRHIEWEIQYFQPKVIILLGNVALRVFNLHNKGAMGKIHGRLFEKKFPGWDDGPTFKIIPTYHPSFFLHRESPGIKKRVLRDFIFATELISGKKHESTFHKPEYKVCSTIGDVKELAEKLNGLEEFAFDTESIALPWKTRSLICFSFSWGINKNVILPIYLHDPSGKDIKLKPAWQGDLKNEVLDLIRVPFENEDIAKIGHNLKYDINVVRRWCKIIVGGKLWCTQSMHHVIDEHPPHDLEHLSDVEFETGDYGAPVREITGHGKVLRNTYDKVPDDKLHLYTATDVESTWRLKQVYHERICRKPHLLKLYEEETAPIIRVLAESEWHGNRVCTDTVKILLKEQDEKEKELEGKILHITQDSSFNPNSPKQVAKMMEKLGYGDIVFTKRKAAGYCVDKEVMERLATEDCELAELILESRKVGKLKSTYLNKALNDLDDDGRIRYSWMIHGTKSGRLSCEFLHQVSRSDSERTKAGKKNLRDILVAEPGFSLVYADYDQIELRILAIEANDKELQRVFANNEDVHQATASAALDILYADVSDENRQLGKSINFGISYGSKGYSLSRKNYFVDPKDGKKKKVTKNMVVKFLGRFHEKFVGIADYLERIPYEAAARNGLIITVFGRERHIIGLNDSNQGRRNHAEREAVNNLIQSPAGAITLRTAIEVYKMLKGYDIKSDIVRFVNTVHDSLVYEVRKDYVLWFREALKIIAERKIPELQNTSFPISIGVGDSWGAAELNSKGK